MMIKLFTAITALAYIVNAQNTTCVPLQADDSTCGVFAPASSVFYHNQAAVLAPQYINQLSMLCEGIRDEEVRATFPLLFCLGAMGPCNNGTFKLPAVNEDGLPQEITSVAVFYNEARFSEIAPSLEKQGVALPCYEACDATMQVIKQCSALTHLGITAGNDNCLGFPFKNDTTKTCTMRPGDKEGNSAPTVTSNKDKPKKTSSKDSSNNSGIVVGINYYYLVFFALVAMLF